MDEPADSTAPTEKKTGRHSTLTPEIHEKILAFVRKGLTYEKAGEALGISPATIQNWQHRNKAFNESLQKARRGLEANLLDSINQAGEKSWQARAWILERSFSYSQPSARLQVTQDHTHNLGGNLAQLLAGIRGRKQITSDNKTAELENRSKYIDVQPIIEAPQTDKSHNKYSLNCDSTQENEKSFPKRRHQRMRLRKPRAESLAKYTTTPPLPPPAAV
jgi:transcriptional regulator with XRE-family HTH domain